VLHDTDGVKGYPSFIPFLFTLRNPHNVQPRKFRLKPERKNGAICCWSGGGPHFGGIAVSDNCNANTHSHTYYFGTSYTNDTGVDGIKFFTGAYKFQVKEIEVFEFVE
jgi:hypothetical protein